MDILTVRRGLALLCTLLSACVTSPGPVHESDEAPEAVASWEEARADPSCVVPRCDEERCALWRCQDLVEVDSHPVVLVRGAVGLRPPLVGNPNRWWGRTLAAPTSVEPVFEIPWHNWKTRDQRAQPKHPLSCMLPPEPLEKHHLFPQQDRLAAWFKVKRIDIHAFTIRLPQGFHRWLHSGGPEGGQWNEAWRQFQRENPGASTERIWQFAFELMERFRVNGPLVP
ncbi:TIGR02269 family lipoprotein [Archangium violaceum]|uniref:SitA6 family polymorphic toxin lipoprotein n=1 Tax=Archangium violaceum TaxID=83451 RepID=UPI00195178F3|nr:TIGR02269 family lipoprotein [Archangium violaceum]QRN96905.1 TIGR02269 family lipoprotein [Archangium violaceum]